MQNAAPFFKARVAQRRFLQLLMRISSAESANTSGSLGPSGNKLNSGNENLSHFQTEVEPFATFRDLLYRLVRVHAGAAMCSICGTF